MDPLGTDAGPVEVKLAEALSIQGRLDLPKGVAVHSVVATISLTPEEE